MPALAKTMAMPPPMVPAPTTAARLTGIVGVSLRHARNFRDFAFGKENVNEGFGLVGEEALGEEALLFGYTFGEWELGGGFDRVDCSERSGHAAVFLASGFAGGREDCGVFFRRAEFVVALACLADGLGGNFFREGHRPVQQIAVDQPIDDSSLQRVARFDRSAIDAHLDCFGDTCETREALRACGAGDEAELHFGLADLRVTGRDAVVPCHCEFEAAAEGGAVDGHDHRLGAIFDSEQQRLEAVAAGGFTGGDLAEFLDVRAGDERAARRRSPPRPSRMGHFRFR